MSREVLCLDGAELTVRQLIRIEKESLLSLDRLSYIAKRLGKNMVRSDWIMTILLSLMNIMR